MKTLELTVNVSVQVPDHVDVNALSVGFPLDRVTVFDDGEVVTHANVKGYDTTRIKAIE